MQLICSSCHKPITEGSYAVIGDDQYIHQNCFLCGECNQPLSAQYIVLDNKFMHRECFIGKHSRRCMKCQQPTLPGESIFTLGDSVIHSQCFTCDNCKSPLNGKYFEKDDKFYDQQCFTELFSPKCSACKLPIPINSSYHKYNDEQYHAECLKCSTCSRLLGGMMFRPLGNQQFECQDCVKAKHAASKEKLASNPNPNNSPAPPVSSAPTPVPAPVPAPVKSQPQSSEKPVIEPPTSSPKKPLPALPAETDTSPPPPPALNPKPLLAKSPSLDPKVNNPSQSAALPRRTTSIGGDHSTNEMPTPLSSQTKHNNSQIDNTSKPNSNGSLSNIKRSSPTRELLDRLINQLHDLTDEEIALKKEQDEITKYHPASNVPIESSSAGQRKSTVDGMSDKSPPPPPPPTQKTTAEAPKMSKSTSQLALGKDEQPKLSEKEYASIISKITKAASNESMFENVPPPPPPPAAEEIATTISHKPTHSNPELLSAIRSASKQSLKSVAPEEQRDSSKPLFLRSSKPTSPATLDSGGPGSRTASLSADPNSSLISSLQAALSKSRLSIHEDEDAKGNEDDEDW